MNGDYYIILTKNYGVNQNSPVAVLIQKCTLEYPQKYGHVEDEQEDWGELSGSKRKNPLLEDVKKWGDWVLEEAKQEIGRFYPEEEDGSILVGYIWAPHHSLPEPCL